MNPNISKNPTNLTYAEFCELNDICFPHEPVVETGFNEFISAHFWTVRIDDSLIGYSVISRGSRTPYIRRLGIHPEYRRSGLATKLMELMIAKAQEEDVEQVFALVEQDNHAVINLNSKFGFEICGKSVNFSINVGSPKESVYRAVPCAEYEWNYTDIREPESLSTLARKHHPPDSLVLVLLARERPIGYTRFCPDYPGCSPFVLFQELDAIQEIVDSLDEYVLSSKRRIGITTGDQHAVTSLQRAGTHVNYKLFEMVKKIA